MYRQSRSHAARIAVDGLLAGFIATLAYDGVRLLLLWFGLIAHPFLSIEQYGLLIVGAGDPRWATSAGWGFHFWNGATFGMFFALAFGRPTILMEYFEHNHASQGSPCAAILPYTGTLSLNHALVPPQLAQLMQRV